MTSLIWFTVVFGSDNKMLMQRQRKRAHSSGHRLRSSRLSIPFCMRRFHLTWHPVRSGTALQRTVPEMHLGPASAAVAPLQNLSSYQHPQTPVATTLQVA